MALLFVDEALIIGVLGGVGGIAVGQTVATIAMVINGWSYSSTLFVLASPAIGAAAALIASAIPAWIGGRTAPAAAMRFD